MRARERAAWIERRKAGARIKNQGIMKGWSAWLELWEEQVAQRQMLASAGARLLRRAASFAPAPTTSWMAGALNGVAQGNGANRDALSEAEIERLRRRRRRHIPRRASSILAHVRGASGGRAVRPRARASARRGAAQALCDARRHRRRRARGPQATDLVGPRAPRAAVRCAVRWDGAACGNAARRRRASAKASTGARCGRDEMTSTCAKASGEPRAASHALSREGRRLDCARLLHEETTRARLATIDQGGSVDGVRQASRGLRIRSPRVARS